MLRRWLLGIIVALVVAEASAWIALRVVERRRGLRYRTFDSLIDAQRAKLEKLVASDGTWYQRIDPDLGWVTFPGAHNVERQRDVKRVAAPAATPNDVATVNQAGVRADREYAEAPPPGVVRIAAFGDSFVHGDEVTTAETWPAQLESLEPGIEVLNYGVGGYGIDQAFLRYGIEGTKLAPRVVLIGVIADDVLRGVNVYRPFVAPETGHVLTKPRFVVDGRKLRLLPNPLRSAADYRAFLADPVPVLHAITPHDLHAPPASDAGPLDFLATVRLVKLLRAVLARPDAGRPAERDGQLDPDAEPGRVALATLRAFVEQVRERGAEPLIVFFPDRTELDARRAGRRITYAPLVARLAAEGLPVVDVLQGLDRQAPGWTTEQLIGHNHYSPYGNRVVAEVLHDALAKRGLLGRERVSRSSR